ncbi:hypothetical protein K8R42_04905 [bacterium]|nr:hypothetical protein [bacterium]
MIMQTTTISNGVKLFLLSLIIFIFLPLIPAEASSKSCLYYFYGHNCPHCQKSSYFIDSLQLKYPYLDVHKFEVQKDYDNQQIFSSLLSDFNISDSGIPTVFIGQQYFIGSNNIINNLEREMLSAPIKDCPRIVIANQLDTHQITNQPNSAKSYLFLGIAVVGLAIFLVQRNKDV